MACFQNAFKPKGPSAEFLSSLLNDKPKAILMTELKPITQVIASLMELISPW